MFDIRQVSGFLKKNFTRKDVLVIVGLALLYFLTRIFHLTQLPIFNDEGIYIHWAKIAWHDAAWRFVSLTDGKQPLQTWGTIPLLKLFPNDHLFAGRMFSVLTGFFGLTAMFTLLFYLFGKRTAKIGSLLYIVIPYFLFYDRMAMVDSGVNAFFIWILFFSILLVRTIRLDVALLFGMFAGMGLLAKSSVRLFVGLSVLAPVLMKDIFHKLKKSFPALLSFLILFGIAGALAFAVYNIQRLSPFLHFVEEKNKTFIMTFSEWRADPFAVLGSNLKLVPYYVFSELGWVIVPFAVLGAVALFRRDRRLCIYLLLWIFISYIGISLLTRVLFPRYIMFFGTLILVFAAYYLGQLKSTRLLAVLLGIIVVAALVFDYFMWFDYKGIIFPGTDRGQYVTGSTVGYGAKEIIEYARQKRIEKPVLIIAEGDFGMAGDILDTFLRPSDLLSIKAYWPLTKADLVANQPELKDKYIYVVAAHELKYPEDWPVKLIKSYYKPGNESVIHFLELTK